jgi:hypothetical protein
VSTEDADHKKWLKAMLGADPHTLAAIKPLWPDTTQPDIRTARDHLRAALLATGILETYGWHISTIPPGHAEPNQWMISHRDTYPHHCRVYLTRTRDTISYAIDHHTAHPSQQENRAHFSDKTHHTTDPLEAAAHILNTLRT